jgi:hypothetical protein
VAGSCSSQQVGPEPAVRGGSSADGPSSCLSPGDPAAAHCCVLRGPTPAAGHAPGRDPVRPPSGDLRSAHTASPPTPATATRPPSSRHIRHFQHADLEITSASLRGTDDTEIIHAVHEQPAPDDSRRPSSPVESTFAPGHRRCCRDRQPAPQAPPPVGPHSTAQPARPEPRPSPDTRNALTQRPCGANTAPASRRQAQASVAYRWDQKQSSAPADWRDRVRRLT